ncbi:MAG: GTP-binding protein, partial [Firmicutes bacterium]|nr:GTP-binding protein [Bacillota bacterium]
MGGFSSKSIRNVAIIGHSGEGKTTLCECMLFNAKAIDRMGKISDGNTVMDYESEEINRNISISLGIANLVWKDTKINLLDAPGFYDFEGEMISALSVADSAIIVMSASGIVSVGAAKAISYCSINKIPMLIFINGIDKENSSYFDTLKVLQDTYPNKIAPLQIPLMEGQKMTGYINMLSGECNKFSQNGLEKIEIPADYKVKYDEQKAKLTETAAENDEKLLEKFFDGQAFSFEELVDGVKKGISTS